MGTDQSKALWRRFAAQLARGQRWFSDHPRIRIAAATLLVVLLIFLLVRSFADQWSALDETALQVDWRWLVAAALLYLLSMLAQMAIWHDIMRVLTGHDDRRDNLTAYNLVNLLRALPGLLFHITARTLYYKQPPRHLSGRSVLRATTVELLLLPIANLLCFVAVVIAQQPWPRPVTVAGLSGLLLVTLLLVRTAARWQALNGWRLGGWLLANCLLLLNGLFFLRALLNSALAIDIPWLPLWQIWLLSSLVSVMATYFLGGISFLRELTVSALLSALIPPPAAVAVAVWSRLIGLATEIVGSGMLLFLLHGRRATTLIQQTIRSNERDA